jgi:hypothetical protein
MTRFTVDNPATPGVWDKTLSVQQLHGDRFIFTVAGSLPSDNVQINLSRAGLERLAVALDVLLSEIEGEPVEIEEDTPAPHARLEYDVVSGLDGRVYASFHYLFRAEEYRDTALTQGVVVERRTGSVVGSDS